MTRYRNTFAQVATACFLIGGFFISTPVIAEAVGVSITTASTVGGNISIDKTTATGGSSTFTNISGPTIIENSVGEISVGTHTVSLPAGWEFKTDATVSAVLGGGDLVLANDGAVSVSSNSFSFTVDTASVANKSTVVISGLKVRPTGITIGSVDMTYSSGAGILGVVSGSTNFGTIASKPGTVTKVVFSTAPAGSVYGADLSTQPVVKTQDQFGNDSTNGLAANNSVVLTLSSG